MLKFFNSYSCRIYIFFSKSILFGENIRLVVKKDSVIKFFMLKHCIAAFFEQKTEKKSSFHFNFSLNKRRQGQKNIPGQKYCASNLIQKFEINEIYSEMTLLTTLV